MIRFLAIVFFFVALAVVIVLAGFALYGLFWILWAVVRLLGP